MPPENKSQAMPRKPGKRTTPIIAMESISERERVQRRKQRTSILARSTATWAVRLIPVFLVLLLGWIVLHL